VARRRIFENRREYREFLARLACCVRAGWLEVHAFCLMPNHFHMLVRSPRGQLSRAMQHLQDGYAQRFNRLRERRGSLFQGRYHAKLVHSMTYRIATFLYIHRNPVSAGICRKPADYPWSSARAYRTGISPRWLATAFGVQLGAAGWSVPPDGDPVLRQELLEDWSRFRGQDQRQLDRMLRGGLRELHEWVERSAGVGGVRPPPCFLLGTLGLLEVLRAHRAREEGARVRLGRRTHDAWSLIEAGLLRAATGATFTRLGDILDQPVATLHSRVHLHEQACRLSPAHVARAARAMHEALQAEFHEIRILLGGRRPGEENRRAGGTFKLGGTRTRPARAARREG
jgi:REP element-mobilizing transposase RayT